MGYRDLDHAIGLVNRGGGSLVASVITHDPEVARQAILEMQRQVGNLSLDDDGVAQTGLLVRHLVLPEGLAGSDRVLAFIAEKVSPDTYVNLMDQYRPCGRAARVPALKRPINPEEFSEALAAAKAAGLRRLDPPRRVFRWG
jgi:putative pyruvate formate lyase activating enzyme